MFCSVHVNFIKSMPIISVHAISQDLVILFFAFFFICMHLTHSFLRYRDIAMWNEKTQTVHKLIFFIDKKTKWHSNQVTAVCVSTSFCHQNTKIISYQFTVQMIVVRSQTVPKIMSLISRTIFCDLKIGKS